MADNEKHNDIDSDSNTAEAKRTAARRRFLRRTGAAGAGVVVVTLHHQRAVAGAKAIITSSAATCLSLHGTVKGTTVVTNKNTGNKTTATQCTLP